MSISFIMPQNFSSVNFFFWWVFGRFKISDFILQYDLLSFAGNKVIYVKKRYNEAIEKNY